MTEKEAILKELDEISAVVAGIPKTNVFTVSSDYFDGIEAELKARISAAEFYTAADPFSVPEGYFEGLTGSIMQKIRMQEDIPASEEIKSLSPVLATIGNRNVFTVPAGYFESKLTSVQIKPAAPVVKMKPRSVFKYAAAAVITGLLGLSIINIVDRSSSSPAPVLTAQTAMAVKSGNEILKSGTFDEELQNLSGDEIEKYLQDNGQNISAALAASAADDPANLPEAADYLLDENTLDNFLNTNNLKN